MRILLLTVFGLILMPSGLLGQENTYSVYALKFKYQGMQSAVGSVAGALDRDSIDVCCMIWFLKGGNGRNILVDTGDLDSTDKEHSNFIRPDLLLRDININPSDITDIIITHPHFDHINGLGLFPNGKIWIQRRDFDAFVAESWADSTAITGFNRKDVRTLVDAALQGRVSLVDGDNIEIIPGITAFTGSTHTRENQYLLANNVSGDKVLLVSDAIWFYMNLDRMTPVEVYVQDPNAYVEAMKRMKTMVPDERFIIPGHDNLVFSNFGKSTDRVVEIRK